MPPDSVLRRGGLALVLALTRSGVLAAQSQPHWTILPAARDRLSRRWSESVAANREQVGCLGGTIGPDTVVISRVTLLETERGDSLQAPAELSLERCGPPEWIGTVHTHVRSTDDPTPAPRFSPDDRIVLSAWSRRWRSRGGFCVLYSDRGAHCEVYPPMSAGTAPSQE